MDHGGGGRRSSSRLRDRLARMFRPATLLRSTCNTTASSSSTPLPGAGASTAASTTTTTTRPPLSSSSRALPSSSSRRDYVVGRTESFSTAVDRLHCRGGVVAPAPPSSRSSVDAPPPLLEVNKDKAKSPRDRRNHVQMKLLSNDPYGFSSSDVDDTDAVFSSDADEGLAGGRRGGANSTKVVVGETFFCSSRSLSSDSSGFYTNTTTTKNKKKKKNKPPLPPSRSSSASKTKEQRRRHRRAAGEHHQAPPPPRNGFAVVKRSRDPYADFRSSMAEMIVGRQLSGAPEELERLLRSYLSLNAPRHHPVILQAFSDIVWVVLLRGAYLPIAS